MDLKDKATVWAGLLTLAILQLQDRVNTQLNIYSYSFGWVGALVTVVSYAIGFVIVFGVLRWILQRYFRANTRTQRPPPPRYQDPTTSMNPGVRKR